MMVESQSVHKDMYHVSRNIFTAPCLLVWFVSYCVYLLRPILNIFLEIVGKLYRSLK